VSTAAPAGVRATPGVPRLRRVDLLAFAVLAYVPALLSSPGKVSGDTKQYLYLDPGRVLSRALYTWDPHIGTGTVPHQNIGYLFPMGPYYWLMAQLGVPDWVAQRLWMGSISFAAAAGALWLLTMLGTRRVGAIAGALVFMLTPYQVAFSARLSALLLPWAGLPWLVGLTIRAAKRGGWRDPCLFALVVLLIGTTNASSLVLVGIAPLVWLVVATVQRDLSPRAALTTIGRIAVPTIGVSLWWAAGLVNQARYGIPVLDVSENLRQVAVVSNPTDILRGLGNWFLSGSDRLGPWLDQAHDYQFERIVTYATLAVPVAGLTAAAVVRWRHRAFCVALVVVGTLVGVGAWPYDDPSPVGSLFKSLAGRNGPIEAIRNTPRVVPVIVLGLAGLIAAGVSALAKRRVLEISAAVAVCIVVALAFLPVWRHGYLSDRILRDDDVPAYWHDVAAALDRGDDGTRALELPGSLFAAYRWGNTVDPVTPGLTDRPWVGRELLAFGTRGSVDLLAALDRRLQEGTFEPSALAPVARLLAAGTIVDRNDLEYERYQAPRPRDVWAWLERPRVPGLGAPSDFGSRAPNRSTSLPELDEIELRSSGRAWPPKVALFPVESPRRIVSTSSPRAPVVLAGDGEGVVDAAAAGIVDGEGVLFYAASLDHAELQQALQDHATLVVTDTARRRARRWDTLKDDVGATERAGQGAIADDVNDFRYEITDDLTDADRTVVQTPGVAVDATAYGDRGSYVTSERPALAFDGDVRTAWRTAGGDQVHDDRLVLHLHRGVRSDGVTLVQPLDGTRPITELQLRVNDGGPIRVALDDRSRRAQGQRVAFPAQLVRKLELEPVATADGPAASVGLAEVRLHGRPRHRPLVEEVVRVPTRLLRRAGSTAARRPLAFMFTRARNDPAEHGRLDEELRLVRRFTLPLSAGAPRAFDVSGTARVDPNAADETIDELSGTTTSGVRFRSSGHLQGSADARASRAFDGSSRTAWAGPFGEQVGQWIEADLGAPTTVEGATVDVVADGRHSVPTSVRVEADGTPVATIALPAVPDDAHEGATRRVPLRFGPVTASRLRFVVESARVVPTEDTRTFVPTSAPVAISDLSVSGVPRAPVSGAPASACRDDLLTLDGVAVPVRVVDQQLTACAGPLEVTAGSHVLRSAVGLDAGIDVDRVVLTSGAQGTAAPVATFRPEVPRSGAQVRVTDSGPTKFDLEVHSDGRPFWLVLGQSHSPGWKAEVSGSHSGNGTLSAPRLVNGYANGWLVDPGGPGTFTVHLRWTPQNLVWVAIAMSVLAILACLGIVFVTRRRAIPDVADAPELASPLAYDAPRVPWRVALSAAVVAGVGAWMVSRAWIGAVIAVGTLVASRVPRGRIVLAAGAPAALVLARATSTPELGWLAVLLLAADLFAGWLAHRRRLRETRPSPTDDRST
jgi:arabinofuranan 3-O-arabinosyltransferase